MTARLAKPNELSSSPDFSRSARSHGLQSEEIKNLQTPPTSSWFLPLFPPSTFPDLNYSEQREIALHFDLLTAARGNHETVEFLISPAKRQAAMEVFRGDGLRLVRRRCYGRRDMYLAAEEDRVGVAFQLALAGCAFFFFLLLLWLPHPQLRRPLHPRQREILVVDQGSHSRPRQQELYDEVGCEEAPKGYKGLEQNALGNVLFVFVLVGLFSGVVLDLLWLIGKGW
ncbi:hypothetical protein PR202_ga29575 [Eleusine coracana subsp. coracana]|uniref:Uncharacterized protein n=1 Tax=Eleusine coracana subsp. coracana TaxID=191504 RepID=A0AAV5DLL2_ELECO|nr:hypothetical protein PR202_ga29575 [Eleusine coracana subsp. coracana]